VAAHCRNLVFMGTVLCTFDATSKCYYYIILLYGPLLIHLHISSYLDIVML